MNTNITKAAKTFRKNPTKAERLLWKNLRAKQLEEFKFRRQQPIGNYVVDFVCFEKQIVIEVDGGQHAREIIKDKEREKWLKKQGFKILRFWNNEVLRNIEGVIEEITKNCIFHPLLTSPIKGEESKDIG
jgi:very-short-patch-repair endonuclease